METVYNEREARRAIRERRGAGHGKYRCFECRRFVRGRHVICGSCGYDHGGINHEAESVR